MVNKIKIHKESPSNYWKIIWVIIILQAVAVRWRMFKRKLEALNYPIVDSFSVSDERTFQDLVLWLEDQKIRHYKIEDRMDLRKIGEPVWQQAFQKYLKYVHCPYSAEENKNVLTDWLLGYAVRLEYGDATELKDKSTEELAKKLNEALTTVSQNPLDKLNFNDTEFIKGVEELAKILGIRRHTNHLITLEAACKLIQTRLSIAAVQNAPKTAQQPPGTKLPIEKYDLGFATGDNDLDNAGRVLRLLHIQEMRNLQTKINETVVAIQEITADPKVDERLGQVGV